MCQLPSVAIAKSHKLGDLNDRNVLSHHSGGWKSKIKVQQGWFLLRAEGKDLLQASPLALVVCRQSLAFLGLDIITPISAFIFTEHSSCVRVCVQTSPFISPQVILD